MVMGSQPSTPQNYGVEVATRLQRLEREVENVKATMIQRETALRAQINESLSRMQGQINIAKQEARAAMSSADQLNTDLGNLQTAEADLETRVGAEEGEISDLQAALAAAQSSGVDPAAIDAEIVAVTNRLKALAQTQGSGTPPTPAPAPAPAPAAPALPDVTVAAAPAAGASPNPAAEAPTLSGWGEVQPSEPQG